jgi:hypothetical protein
VEQTELLKYTATKLSQLQIPYAVVGSFASSIWGESRLTQDIDIVVDLKLGHVPHICAAFPDPEFYVSSSAVREAIEHASQFNVIHPSSGNKLDFMIASRTAWQREQLTRCKQAPIFPDLSVSVAAPDDVILGKLIYYRAGESEKHLRDIAGILDQSGPLVDRAYLDLQTKQLGVGDLWEAIQNSQRSNQT